MPELTPGDWRGDALVGRVLDDRYRLDALLGEGGMGAVYRAQHLAMDRRVAVKVLRPHLVGDPIAARRFAREARGTFKVGSEHAVSVLDFAAAADGTLYMVLEYLDGRTVAAEITVDGPLAPPRALRVARQICDALGAAHRLGLVHRDIKPDNVMLIRHGGDPDFVKVLDFGLARLMAGAAPGVLSHAALTQGDMVFGTPEYMSPEQATGQPLDGRSDLYAVGATLFEMLTGRPPFVETSPMALLARHVQAPPPRLVAVRPELAAWPGHAALDALVQRCLAKAPSARPPSAEALAAELVALESGETRPRGRVAPAVAMSQTQDMEALPLPAAPATISGEYVEEPRRRRGAIAVVGALVAVGAVAIAVVLASRSASVSPSATAASRSPSPSPSPSPPPPPSPPPSPSPSPSPAHTDAPRPARPRPVRSAAPPDEAVARHLAAADAARRADNRLRQLAEADAALRLDPRSVRARYLLGDALVATGDAATGCRYLRAARRLPEARAALGGCPPD